MVRRATVFPVGVCTVRVQPLSTNRCSLRLTEGLAKISGDGSHREFVFVVSPRINLLVGGHDGEYFVSLFSSFIGQPYIARTMLVN